MKRSVRIATVVFFVVAVVCAQTQTTQTTTLSSGSATVADFKGEVQIQSASVSATQPQKGEVLPAESIIETGKGSVVLNLQDGSQVLIRANTRVTLKDPAKGESFLQQWIGKILVKAQKRLSGAPSFKMGTPSAVISVRGTQFEVAVNKTRKTSVSVLEGQVEVRGLRGGAGVLLGPGFGTSVIENEPPERPHELPAGAAHSSGGSSMRYQREDDWPSGRPQQNGESSQSPVIPEEGPEFDN